MNTELEKKESAAIFAGHFRGIWTAREPRLRQIFPAATPAQIQAFAEISAEISAAMVTAVRGDLRYLELRIIAARRDQFTGEKPDGDGEDDDTDFDDD